MIAPERQEELRFLAAELAAQMTADPCLTVSQTARRMGFSEPTIYRLITEKKLKTVPGFVEKRVKQSTADAFGK